MCTNLVTLVISVTEVTCKIYSVLDEIFLPKEDVENGELDEYEREIEEFKRFCLDSTPAEKREKVQVTMNMKDIFSKKKSGLLA
ncbi:hypothetical protein LSAT2_025117 [Lamellibrachia satsuma]|nr:hypothetical protein LSAT2_025117 [Lamellibrachia satsuma]